MKINNTRIPFFTLTSDTQPAITQVNKHVATHDLHICLLDKEFELCISLLTKQMTDILSEDHKYSFVTEKKE
jgi:hypothetical protein